MTFSSRTQAYDAIMAFLQVGWTASAYSAVPLHFPDEKDDTPPTKTAWLRVQFQHKRGGQATINSPGNRRFRAFGMMIVEVRTPLGDGLTTNQGITDTLDAILEGQETGPQQVIFREITPSEIGPDGVWFLTKYVVNFEYDRIK